MWKLYSKKWKCLFVKCEKGNKFCLNCGKDLQNKEKCKNEEEIEKLFEKYKNI